MFNKTIRSALSLALVLCMVLGLCGNALAVNVPGGATVTNRFNSVIEQLESAIDNLEAQINEHEKTLADGESKLEDGKEKLEEGREKLAELKQLLADAENAINEEGGYRDQLAAAFEAWEAADALWQEYDALYAEKEDALAAAEEELNRVREELGLLELYQAMMEAEAAYYAKVEELGNPVMIQIDELYMQISELEAALNEKLYARYPELVAAVDAAELLRDELNMEANELWNQACDAEIALWDELDALRAAGYEDGDPEIEAVYAALDEVWTPFYDKQAEASQADNAYWIAVDALNAKRSEPEFVGQQTEIDALYDEVNGLWNDYYAIYENPELILADKAWIEAQENYYAVVNNMPWQVLEPLYAADDAVWNAQMQLDEARMQLDDAKLQLDDAQRQMDYAEEIIADAKEAIDTVEAEMDEAEGIIADAEAILADAKPAMEQAHLTIADARAIIANLEAAYADLQDAINNPKANAAYVKDLIRTMQADMRTLWNSVKDLQDSANALLDAYAALEGKSLVYDGFYYYHEAVRYELPNGDVYEYPEVIVNVEGFTYNMPQLPANAERLVNLLDTVLTRAVNAYQTARYYWLLAKDKLGLDIEISVESLDLLTRANARKVYDWLCNNPDKVVAAVKEYGLYALDLLYKYGPYAEDFLRNHSDIIIKSLKLMGGAAYLGAEYIYAHSAGIMGFAGKAIDFLMQYKGQVMNVARKLYAKYGDEAKALINVYVDYLNLEERYFDAIHADYTIYHDSLYVALGDETASGYSDKLAELLEIGNAENLTDYGMSVGDAILQVGENAGLIASADLITLGFSNLAADKALLNALAGEDVTNWTKVLGQELVDAIESALGLLRNRLTTDGYPTQTVDEIVLAASAYTYHYAARAIRFPQLIKAIREVNADALIVIVGAYNELDNVVIEYAGREINLGSINRFMIKATNLENLVQAMYTENVVYASAYEVETVYEANGAEPTNLLGLLMSFMEDEMLPSEAGEAYIAEQILNTLNVNYAIMGDVNGDHVVDCFDARMVLCYSIGKISADDIDEEFGDVNGDGEIDAFDARMILRMCVGQIEHFPVCGLN